MIDRFTQNGWVRFPFDAPLARWVSHVKPIAEKIAADDGWRRDWLRCGGTWFVGANCLPNDPDGAVDDVPLTGQAVDFVQKHTQPRPIIWDNAQVSVCYAGYPKPSQGESEAALRFRRYRDAAHVDGLHREGPENRRFLREFHQFVLGIPLNKSPAEAAPFVVWEGSHLIMRAAFQAALRGYAPQDWTAVDLTNVYQKARREVFERCDRVEVVAKPGEAYVVHRHALHGVAPWAEGVAGPDEGRMIAYFRPVEGVGMERWLSAS